MPRTASLDSATASEPRMRTTVSAHQNKTAATWSGPGPRAQDNTANAAKSTTAPPAPASSQRIRRRSVDGDRWYRRYSMNTPSTPHRGNVYCNTAAAGPTEPNARRNSGLTMTGSAGSANRPPLAVGLESSSTGSSTAARAAVRSAQRSPARCDTPVGNSPISPIPATTVALPAHSAASTTAQAYDESCASNGTTSPRHTPRANIAPDASSQAATRRPGPRTTPTSPATYNGAGPASTQ